MGLDINMRTVLCLLPVLAAVCNGAALPQSIGVTGTSRGPAPTAYTVIIPCPTASKGCKPKTVTVAYPAGGGYPTIVPRDAEPQELGSVSRTVLLPSPPPTYWPVPPPRSHTKHHHPSSVATERTTIYDTAITRSVPPITVPIGDKRDVSQSGGTTTCFTNPYPTTTSRVTSSETASTRPVSYTSGEPPRTPVYSTGEPPRTPVYTSGEPPRTPVYTTIEPTRPVTYETASDRTPVYTEISETRTVPLFTVPISARQELGDPTRTSDPNPIFTLRPEEPTIFVPPVIAKRAPQGDEWSFIPPSPTDEWSFPTASVSLGIGRRQELVPPDPTDVFSIPTATVSLGIGKRQELGQPVRSYSYVTYEERPTNYVPAPIERPTNIVEREPQSLGVVTGSYVLPTIFTRPTDLPTYATRPAVTYRAEAPIEERQELGIPSRPSFVWPTYISRPAVTYRAEAPVQAAEIEEREAQEIGDPSRPTFVWPTYITRPTNYQVTATRGAVVERQELGPITRTTFGGWEGHRPTTFATATRASTTSCA
ncbi:hypothetical protein B0J14DRAFT_283637 [Halenospora varia]|nr:hypothetical protein B0J14DRAFT_283637 [Halenospora varia]